MTGTGTHTRLMLSRSSSRAECWGLTKKCSKRVPQHDLSPPQHKRIGPRRWHASRQKVSLRNCRKHSISTRADQQPTPPMAHPALKPRCRGASMPNRKTMLVVEICLNACKTLTLRLGWEARKSNGSVQSREGAA